MRFVLDSNVLFSALIKDSYVRKIILENGDKFLFPIFIFEELREHREEIQKKSGLSKKEFRLLLKKLLNRIDLVSLERIVIHGERAMEIVKDIDEKDASFFACALAYPGSAILSEDKALKKQTEIPVYNTQEFVELLNKDVD